MCPPPSRHTTPYRPTPPSMTDIMNQEIAELRAEKEPPARQLLLAPFLTGSKIIFKRSAYWHTGLILNKRNGEMDIIHLEKSDSDSETPETCWAWNPHRWWSTTHFCTGEESTWRTCMFYRYSRVSTYGAGSHIKWYPENRKTVATEHDLQFFTQRYEALDNKMKREIQLFRRDKFKMELECTASISLFILEELMKHVPKISWWRDGLIGQQWRSVTGHLLKFLCR